MTPGGALALTLAAGGTLAALLWPRRADAPGRGDAPPPPPPPPPPAGTSWVDPLDPHEFGRPLWPLVGTASRRVTGDVGKCRPRRLCELGRGQRHHAGEDLPAPRGTLIVAPERGTIVHVAPEWYDGSGVLLLETDAGLVLAFGEIGPDSEREFGRAVGDVVEAGAPLARVGRHRQLHFEVYAAGTRRTQQWPLGTPPPAALRNPVPYLLAAAEST